MDDKCATNMTKPKINPPFRSIDIILEALAGICILYLVVQLLVEYPAISQQVPTHFAANGTPDAWGNKSSLLIIPVVAIVLYTGLTLLNRYPYIFNYPVPITEENAIKQYQLAKSLVIALKLTTIGLFLYIQLQTIRVAQQIQGDLGTYYLIIIVIGSFIPIVIYFILATKNK